MKRVLHVLRKLDAGGVECWLRDLTLAGLPGWAMDFVVEVPERGTLQTDLERCGAAIHVVPKGDVRALGRLLKERGYSAVHSHVHAFSGAVLAIAKWAGVPVRIAHSHCCEDGGGSIVRRGYFAAMRKSIETFATTKLAVSRAAGLSLFGEKRFRIVPPARRFRTVGATCRNERLVIGHVGRAIPVKNHKFLYELAQRLDCDLLLSTEASPEEIYARSDVFVFPSLSEGLGLAVIEAQAAGLPCVVSDAVPEEACVVPRLVARLPLAAGITRWCEAIQTAAFMGRRPDAMQWILKSPYHLDASIAALTEVYSGV